MLSPVRQFREPASAEVSGYYCAIKRVTGVARFRFRVRGITPFVALTFNRREVVRSPSERVLCARQNEQPQAEPRVLGRLGQAQVQAETAAMTMTAVFRQLLSSAPELP